MPLQSFVTLRFLSLIALVSVASIATSPPSGSPPSVAGSILGTIAGYAVLATILKLSYVGARRLIGTSSTGTEA